MSKSWFIKILVLFVFLGILLDSIYSCPNHRTVCKCNHNSKKETHKKFKDTDCHQSIEGRHVCKCKKEKSNEDISHFKQIKFFQFQWNLFSINLIFQKLHIAFFSSPNKGYAIVLIKPPKDSFGG